MGLTLEPQTPPAPRTSGKRWRIAVVLVAVVAALGFVLFQSLGDATTFFRNADEAVAQRESLGDKRFRLQGVVVPDSVEEAGGGVTFAVEHNGVSVDVLHRGDPPELFRASIPVVLEGRWQDERFESDRILVKHTSEYEAEHPERVPDTAP